MNVLLGHYLYPHSLHHIISLPVFSSFVRNNVMKELSSCQNVFFCCIITHTIYELCVICFNQKLRSRNSLYGHFIVVYPDHHSCNTGCYVFFIFSTLSVQVYLCKETVQYPYFCFSIGV